ncbi:MAG TPA: serine/threonine-protein kinase [Gemmatimonadaceae bacterium]|nr:serine/threonine-protein kinase [Gemmatimonadaceae bacterium]
MERLAAALADRYRIESEVGSGGMAHVYRAHDLKHGRAVALKVLRPELAYAVGSDRFIREISTTANLRHPHILPLYDSGDVEGALYYVMPLIDGETLRARIDREGPLPIDESLRITREVADALGYAHERGIAHRDIKPENILLERGHAVVADFGIARAVAATGTDRLTDTGLAVGTPLYMSPEQASGDSNIDGRSDLYSLGCVLYEMLTGRPPFTGSSAVAITKQHLIADPPAVTSTRSDVPASVSGAIRSVLSKDPADRPYPASRFAEALTSHESAERERARRSTTAWTPTRIFSAAIVVLVVVASAWFVSARSTTRASSIGRIAVLPMENQTGDSAQAFFADGMTREVIGVLTDAGIRVLGYRAVAPYRNSNKPVRDIAKELGVDAIVSGAVQRAGDVVSLSAELINAETNENLWSRTFERPATDVVTLQRNVAAEIARGIRAKLTPNQQQRLAAARSVNPRAYAQYLLAQEAAALRTADGFQRSVAYLRRSLDIDSTYAPAWATLAITATYALIYQTAPRDSAYRLAISAADKAIALDDAQGDAYFARGVARIHNEWDFPGGYADLDAAKSRPSSSLGLGLLGWVLWETHDFNVMFEGTRRLIEQEPTTAQWRSDLAWGLWSSGNNTEALASARAGAAADSSFYEVFDIMSLILADTGDFAAADSAHARAVKVAGGDYWVRVFDEGLIASRRGDTSGVKRAISKLDGDPRLAQRGGLLLLVDKKDSAYAMLNRALDARDVDLLQVLNAMPALYPFRQEPRYQELMARMGMPERLRR